MEDQKTIGRKENLPTTTQKAKLPQISNYIASEVFLENIGYFTPSSKRIKGIVSKEKVIGTKENPDGTKQPVKTEIIANARLWLPITSDLDYYRAFLKICDEIIDRDRRFNLPIVVPTRRLIRYAGKTVSAKEWKEVRDWFDRMTGTLIRGGIWLAKIKGYQEGFSGTLFSQVVFRGNKLKNGKIAETNYVWPSPWFLSNFYYRHTRPIDFNFYRRLRKPIAKSLWPLLETGWYASSGEPYSKSYQDLCDEFLIAKRRHLSRVREQLDPSHKELQREGFLERWSYRKAKQKPDFIITWWPGPKYYKDQTARESRLALAGRIDRGGERQNRQKSALAELSEKQEGLLYDILEVCGDRENENAYKKAIREYPEDLIWVALSATKQAAREGGIKTTKGAYFTGTLKKLSQKQQEDKSDSGVGESQKSVSESQKIAQKEPLKQEAEPSIQEPEKEDKQTAEVAERALEAENHSLAPEKRAVGELEIWSYRFKIKHKRPPTPQEQEKKKQELYGLYQDPNYGYKPEYLRKKESVLKPQTAKDKQWKEWQERTPEQKIASELYLWVGQFQKQNGKLPTDEQMEEKKQELLADIGGVEARHKAKLFGDKEN